MAALSGVKGVYRWLWFTIRMSHPKSFFYDYTHMSLNTYQKISIVGKAASVAAVATLVLPMAVHAAGLGKITVLSSLGQPLKAEIELTNVSNRERASLVANIAKPDDFANAKITFDPVFSSLNFAIKQVGARDIIEVTSAQSINLALVDILIEVTGGRRRLLREYSFLLDPVRAQRDIAAQAAAANTTAPAAKTSATPAQAPVAEQKPVVKAVAGNTAATAPQSPIATSGDHNVVHGDMLSQIALHYKPKGVSLNQMMIALYRANPDAFVNNNINRLKAGKILALPTAEAARGIDTQEARSVVIAHTDDFNEYRNQLAGKVGTDAAKKPVGSVQSAQGKVAVKVEENKPAVTEPQDKLTLTKSGTGANGKIGANTSAAAVTENKIAAGKATAEASSRVQELEKNVAELQKLLDIKNQALAQARNAATATAVPAPDVAVDDQGAAVTSGDSDRVTEIKEKAGELSDKTASFWEKTTAVAKGAWTSVAPFAAKAKAGLANAGSNPLTWPIVGGLLLLVGAGSLFAWRRRQIGADNVADTQRQEGDLDSANEAVPATGLPETNIGLPEQSSGAGGLTFDVGDLAETDDALINERAIQPIPNLADKIDFDLELDSGVSEQGQEPYINDGTNVSATVGTGEDAVVAETPDLPAPVQSLASDNKPDVVQDERLELDLPPEKGANNADQEEENAFSVEMNMKLDLAAAYQEIGDNEGARELLEEVINGGNEALATRAREMMDALV